MKDEAEKLQAEFTAADNPPRLPSVFWDPLRGTHRRGGRCGWTGSSKWRAMPPKHLTRPSAGLWLSFLTRKRVQAESGERSMGRYDGYRRCLTDFRRVGGQGYPVRPHQRQAAA